MIPWRGPLEGFPCTWSPGDDPPEAVVWRGSTEVVHRWAPGLHPERDPGRVPLEGPNEEVPQEVPLQGSHFHCRGSPGGGALEVIP